MPVIEEHPRCLEYPCAILNVHQCLETCRILFPCSTIDNRLDVCCLNDFLHQLWWTRLDAAILFTVGFPTRCGVGSCCSFHLDNNGYIRHDRHSAVYWFGTVIL